MGESKQCGDVLAVWERGLVFRNAFDFKQDDLRVLGDTLCGRRLSHLCHHIRKRAAQLESLAPFCHCSPRV